MSALWIRPHQEKARPLAVLVRMFPKLSETFILEEILGLERMGIPIRLYALAAPSDEIVHPAVARVLASVTQVPEPGGAAIGRLLGHHLRALARAPLRYAGAVVDVLRRGRAHWGAFAQAGWLAQQLRIDGVGHLHVHFISGPADVALLTSKIAKLPFSISAHAKDIYLSSAESLARKLHSAQFTVTCTQFNVDALSRAAPAAHICRMYHGIDRSEFHPRQRIPSNEPPLILAVGRLRPKKGFDTLIDACLKLREGNVSFRCEIVGYGEQRDRLLAKISEQGMDGSIRLLGKMSREQVVECYTRADILVQPSRIAADGDRDGIPNVILEAMSMGLPVVASNVSGIPEIVRNEESGLLVEPDDPVLLAAAIARLLTSPELGKSLAGRARHQVAARFDNARNLRRLCQLFRDCGALSPGAQTESASEPMVDGVCE